MKSRKKYFVAAILLVAALSVWWCFRQGNRPAPMETKTPPPVKTWEHKFSRNIPLPGGNVVRMQSVDCKISVIWKNIDTAPPKDLLDKVEDEASDELRDVVSGDLNESKSAQARARLESQIRDTLNNFLKSEKADFEIDSVKISELNLSTS